jgi:hypothetical protein|tara:strand:+ start:178 stop:825 length:648 start_codon:yes stop_codon:yes gene_type:complete
MSKITNVVWNPGNFGHFLNIILQGQSGTDLVALDTLDSHTECVEDSAIKVELVHPYDVNKVYDDTWIKPYFASEQLTYFPFYCNYIKYLKLHDVQIDIRDFVISYHDWQEPMLKQNNVNMDLLFTNTKLFVTQLEEILQQTLKPHVINFIETKKRSNMVLYNNFLQITSDPIDYYSDPIVFAIKVCQYIGNKAEIFNRLEPDLKSKEKIYIHVQT